MARWGEFKWGTAKWGAVPVERRLTWYFGVDWFDNGLLDGHNDGRKAFYLETSNGRQYFLDNAGSGFQPVESGKITIKIRDDEGKYDPYNPASPYYGNLVPGKKFELRVRREDTGSLEWVMIGKITDVRPSDGSARTVTIKGENDVQLLKKKRIYSPVMTSYRYNEAIEDILVRAGWAQGINVDGIISDTMPYWWADGKEGFYEIQSLVDAAIGRFFVAEDGTARYMSRLSDDLSVTIIRAEHIDYGYGVKKTQPWESVRNVVRVYARARNPVANQVLWELSESVQLLPGETKKIGASFALNQQPVPASNVYNLIATSDYLANTASDGSGSDKTASVAIVSMNKFSTSAIITFQNNDVEAIYLTWVRVRGDAIVVDPYTFAEEIDAGSVFDEQMLELKSDWLQSMNDAIEASRNLLGVLSTPRIFPRIKFRNLPEKQFGIKLFDMVTFDIPEKLLSGDMRVGYITHKSISPTLDVFDTEMQFEPTLTGNISGSWMFPAVFGVTTIFA